MIGWEEQANRDEEEEDKEDEDVPLATPGGGVSHSVSQSVSQPLAISFRCGFTEVHDL